MMNHYAEERAMEGQSVRGPLIRIDIPGLPIAQPRQRHRAFVTKAGRVASSNYTPAAHPVNGFKALLALAARKVWRKAPLEGPLRVEVTFRFPLPASAKAAVKRQVAAGEWVPHTTKPDADNLWKSSLDGLTGIVFVDDKQIAEGIWRKGYGSQPGVTVLVWQIGSTE
jgi:Holliday junction resolvase RusA-like endonuclease